MNCHGGTEQATHPGDQIVLVGNHNVGKSLIFGWLTGTYATVANYPGTTVELTRGTARINGHCGVIDTPGINSLNPLSEDERVTRDVLLNESIRTVVQVADAKNLRRALLITSQLAEMNLPLVLVLNMMDEARARAIQIDTNALAEKIGAPVISTSAINGEGLRDLALGLDAPRVPKPLQFNALDARVRWVDDTLHQVYTNDAARTETFAGALGRWAVHPVWGVPIIIAVLFLMYQFVGKFGAGTLVNFIEGTVFGEWINPVITQIVQAAIPIPFIQDFLVGKYGLITVALTYGFAIILPIVLTFFIAFGMLEDSGYLPRLAVMADRAFKAMGLNGKAVLPMVLGLGCDTMATMTTRTLETNKDRILVTLLLALGVPCSAQLGVVLGMLAGMDARATLIWCGVVTLVIFIVGWLAAQIIPGSRSDFIVELPPIRIPRVSQLIIKTLARLEWYLKEVLPLFVLGTAILFALDALGALTWLERAAEPLIVNWLGLPASATEAFLIGFLRRDYGAAGFFILAREGALNSNQILVALVTITLFIPCIANFFVMVKERGWKTALVITAFVFPTAFGVGGALNWILGRIG